MMMTGTTRIGPGVGSPPMPNAPTSYAMPSAMITPAIFLTANGSLIISTSNRMSRVVDRIRVLNDLADTLCRGASDLDYVRERVAHMQDQLNRLMWRGGRGRPGPGARSLGL